MNVILTVLIVGIVIYSFAMVAYHLIISKPEKNEEQRIEKNQKTSMESVRKLYENAKSKSTK